MKRIFLEKYFPASRAANIRKEIYGIKQYIGESLHEYWERNMLDAASGGVFVDKTPVQARNLIENMAANSQQFGTVRSDPTPGRNNEVCGICTTRGHATDMCPTLQEGSAEQVNAAGGFPRPPQRKYDPYSNTYNPDWKDHPNLRYGNPQAIQAPPHNLAYRPSYPQQPQHPQVPTPGETRASIQQLKTQMGQLATVVNRLEALNLNSLPSQTVVNPRENVSAITLRSGKELKVNEEVVKEPVRNKDEQESKLEEDDTIQEAPRGSLLETDIVVQMADKSTIFPRGVIEDVFVQVSNLIFPDDFYVLDMKNNDLNSPTLLGRPFLKTSKSIIDVDNGTLTMEFEGEITKFNIFDTLKNPSCESDVNILDVNDHLSQGQKKFVIEDKLKEIVVRPAENSNSKSFPSYLQESKTEPKLPLDRSKGIPKKSKKRKHGTKLTGKLLKWVKVDKGTRNEPP
ncbi:uncharacterized protein [Henckelia pumila]|uniref:uncharacterized protein n=1 Tax=Henckelia pumila TaxID=405737 RepID=UPI003C6E0284